MTQPKSPVLPNCGGIAFLEISILLPPVPPHTSRKPTMVGRGSATSSVLLAASAQDLVIVQRRPEAGSRFNAFFPRYLPDIRESLNLD